MRSTTSLSELDCISLFWDTLPIAAVPELLEALELARALIQESRWRFPKSIQHPDTFQMSLADSAINKALTKAGYALAP